MCMGPCPGSKKNAAAKKASANSKTRTNAYSPTSRGGRAGFGNPSVKIKFGSKK